MTRPIDQDELLKLLPRLKVASSAGFTGYTYAWIRSGCSDGSVGREYTSAMVKFLNAVHSGLNEAERSIWCSSKAQLIPKEGGAGLRPLNILSSLHRIYNRLMNSRVAYMVGQRLAPLQLAVGIPNGAEIAAAAMEACLETGLDVIKLDMENGFGLIPRRLIYDRLRTYCPQLLEYFAITHGERSKAFLPNGFQIGWCSRGVRQGDPLAGLFYAIGTFDTNVKARDRLFDHISRLVGEGEGRMALAFADDTSFALPPLANGANEENEGGMSDAEKIVRDTYAEDRIRVNQDKAVTISNDPLARCNAYEDGPLRGQPKPAMDRGSINFGVIYGADEYMEAQLLAKFDGMTQAVNPAVPLSRFLLRRLGDLERGDDNEGRDQNLRRQDVFAMISYCVNARAMYSARNVPPDKLMPTLIEFDRRVDAALAALIGLDSEVARAELKRIRALPRVSRGLGVTAYSAHFGMVAQQAFFACTRQLRIFFSSEMGVKLVGGSRAAGTQSFRLLEGLMNCRYLPEVAPDMPPETRALCVNEEGILKQRLVYRNEVKLIHEELLDQGRQQAASLWLSGQHPQALAFLDYHGTLDPRLRLDNESWMQYARLIANQPPLVPPAVDGGGEFCPCRENIPLVDRPWHGLVCKANAQIVTNRHNSIVLAIYQHILHNVGQMGNDDFLVADFKKLRDEDEVNQQLDPQRRCWVTNMEGHRAQPGDRSRVDIVLRRQGVTIAFDVALVNPSAQMYLGRGSDRNPEVALSHKWEQKRNKYVPILPIEDASFRFYPLVFDVMGRMQEDAFDFLHNLSADHPPRWRTLKRLMSSRIAEYTSQNVINVNGLAEAAAMAAADVVDEFGDENVMAVWDVDPAAPAD